VNGERSSVVREPHGPIEPMFDLHVRGPDGVMNLIERPLISNREILPQTATSLDTQGRIQRAVRRRRSMQIHRLGREDGKWLIVARQICRQALIRGLNRRDLRQPHLFTDPIVERLKQPFHSPRGLRRVGRDQLDPQRPPACPH
jgi:hypothetical protein